MPITIVIHSDASLAGWGATDSVSTVGAPWKDADDLLHINVLELTAARLALDTLATAARSTHIQLKIGQFDGYHLHKQNGGTHSPECNHVTAAYIPGDSNVVADFHSHCFHENKEWALKDAVFALLPTAYVSPVIDLFASSVNAKLPRYISWLPHAYAVDAFIVSWQDLTFYAFPPFSLLPRVLAKIIQDKATGLLIVPKWTTQSWFPLVLTLLIQHPRLIAPGRDLLYLPKQPQVVHPLHKKLSLLVVLLSGMPSRVSAYRTQLRPSSRNPGTRVQYDSLLRGWQGFCSRRQVHPLSPTILDVIAYLTSMYDRGLQYATIAAAKSVLAGVLHILGVTSISSHPLIIRLLKGIFHVRPPKPRYEFIWDTDLLLKFLKTLHPAVIPLKLLTLKTVTLLTLLSGQRVSTLHLSQLQRDPTLVIFNIQGLLKHSRAAKRALHITYHAFPHDVALCPVVTLDA